MKDELISFKTAVLLKKIGFKEAVNLCYADGDERIAKPYNTSPYSEYYNDLEYYSAPTQTFLQRWLRENYNLHIQIEYSKNHNDQYGFYIYSGGIERVEHELYILDLKNLYYYYKYKRFEEALEEGLQQALKLIKNNIKNNNE